VSLCWVEATATASAIGIQFYTFVAEKQTMLMIFQDILATASSIKMMSFAVQADAWIGHGSASFA
jgi:hypothetical protein